MVAPFIPRFALMLMLMSLLLSLSCQQRRDDRDTWVSERVQAVDLTAAESSWEKIAWAPDMYTAIDLARRHNRAIFVLAHAGALDGRA